MVFVDSEYYTEMDPFDEIVISDIVSQIKSNSIINAVNKNSNKTIKLRLDITDREQKILLCGGYINYIKSGRG